MGIGFVIQRCKFFMVDYGQISWHNIYNFETHQKLTINKNYKCAKVIFIFIS